MGVMAGLWAMGRWGMTWLISELTGEARSPSDYRTFVLGPGTAGLLAVVLGFTAALNMGRVLAADPPPDKPASKRP